MKIQAALLITFCLPAFAQASETPFMRFVQKWHSVLISGEPTESPDTKQVAHERIPQVDRGAVPRVNSGVEQHVNQQVTAIQAQIDREQQTLESRMMQLAKQREAALEKHDSNQLRRIEMLEHQIVEAYEQQIQRIIGSATIQASTLQQEQAHPANQRVTNPNKQVKNQVAPSPPKEQKNNHSAAGKQRRFPFFPFN
ncbi:MAG: hypothetical protein JW829_13985 [Pirellulales bacterium]|nr:hypothetical protein [Pirellulales bacterium]